MATFVAAMALVAPLPSPVMSPRVLELECSGACARRVQHLKRRAHKRRVVRPYRAWLRRVAQCESGNRWGISTGNGFHGGMQFTISSWRAVGGRGMPHHASQLEQSYRAVRLLKLQGPGAWPVCAR